MPVRAQQLGFRFHYRRIDEALVHLCNPRPAKVHDTPGLLGADSRPCNVEVLHS
jgi:hypothetical protein